VGASGPWGTHWIRLQPGPRTLLRPGTMF
jgi:hypothetical protein